MSKKGQLAESGTWYFWSYAARACHPSNGRTLRYVGICIEHNASTAPNSKYLIHLLSALVCSRSNVCSIHSRPSSPAPSLAAATQWWSFQHALAPCRRYSTSLILHDIARIFRDETICTPLCRGRDTAGWMRTVC